MSDRLKICFADLMTQNRAGLVTFLTAGDPDFDTSLRILASLPNAGADILEIGMPFSDPMADGPSIQAASLRALDAGMTLAKTVELAARVRDVNPSTPIVLMGYYNPIHQYGRERFLSDARAAGVDGLIIVDLPPEEDGELCLPALEHGLAFIRLATPTTHDVRLERVLENASGFIYYVSVTGITGTAAPVTKQVADAVARIKRHTALPVAVGFGIREPEQAAEIAKIADAAVVGTALVDIVAGGGAIQGRSTAPALEERVLAKVRALSDAVQSARV